MARACRQHQHIARLDAQRLPRFAAERQPRIPAGDAQRLVRIGMKVVIVENPVTPQWGPMMAGKQGFEGAGNVLRRVQLQPV
ncbi:hypothetical protein D3C76_1565660 [compost metagenome]